MIRDLNLLYCTNIIIIFWKYSYSIMFVQCIHTMPILFSIKLDILLCLNIRVLKKYLKIWLEYPFIILFLNKHIQTQTAGQTLLSSEPL